MSADFTDKQLGLINDWLDGTNHMADLCRMHAMTSGQLSAFMAEDRVIAFITRITTLLELRARHMLADAKVQSIARLRHILETANNPETARRAATTLLEYRDRPFPPPRGEGQGGVGSPPQSPPSPTTPNTSPSPAHLLTCSPPHLFTCSPSLSSSAFLRSPSASSAIRHLSRHSAPSTQPFPI
ncbi:MAG TPA: hypothetical protein VHN77_03195 [Phycisphaerales bacterium]|nr:hypothetical protein [Phycisphaerales bacterium]